MSYHIEKYTEPNFHKEEFVNSPDVQTEAVIVDGISPKGYHAMSVYPEYFKVNGKWMLLTGSRMDTVCVVDYTPGRESVRAVEFRNLKIGDRVAIGRTEDGSEGIFLHHDGFVQSESQEESFAFRYGRSRETAYSIDYDNLYELLEYEKRTGGHVTWIIGSALSLDRGARSAMEELVNKGYVDALFCGNGTAAIDLEMGVYGKAWGQDIFLREQNTNTQMYDTINSARRAGSLKAFIDSGEVKDGFVKAMVENDLPLIISCSIRDRFPLPGAYTNVYSAQDAMRAYSKKSGTVIMMGAILFTIATGNMTPAYNEFKGSVRPVYIYAVDIQEFAVNKLTDRGSLTATSIVTNVQDFIKNVNRAL